MEHVVNYRAEERQISKASERVNRFIDSILRKSKVNLSESEMESKLNMALVIFRHIEDKDVFEKVFSKCFYSFQLFLVLFEIICEPINMRKFCFERNGRTND